MKWLLALLLLAVPVTAEEVVGGLSQSRISITSNFDGSEILIFGAVRREAPEPDGTLGVIVTIEGPQRPLTVRRKEKRFGIWVNTEAVEVDHAPTFYAVATSGEWDEIIRDTEDLRHRISIPRSIRAVGTGVADTDQFIEAVMRIRARQDLYQRNIGSVDVQENTLFSTSVRLPANLTEGDYTARFVLTRDRAVVHSTTQTIPVQKVGLERFLYNLAHDQPLIYGLLSLAIAIAAGWLASAAFRFIRN